MSLTRKPLPRRLRFRAPAAQAWAKKLLPRSLRTRLILSFATLIFVSLFLAASATVVLIKQQQERSARERVGVLAAPVARDAAFLEASGVTSPSDILDALQEYYQAFDVRILLLDRDAVVVEDTGETLRSATISQLRLQGVQARALGDPPPFDGRYRTTHVRSGPDSVIVFASSQGVVALPTGPGGVQVPRFQAVVAVDEDEIQQAWRELVPRFFMAGGVASLGSVIAAGLLARSITRPLRQITQASEEMARGHYDQQIPAYGGEEVGRLARAFNEMAQQVSRSNRTLRDFLGNVSHELKTPLTSIQGFSQAMVDGALSRPDDYAEAGRIINDEAVRMRGLVDDLLYLSQIDSGEVVMHFEPLAPNELLSETEGRFGRRAAQKQVSLVVDAGQTPQIRGDSRRLEQAIANITENAVRHTPAGGRVTLSSNARDGHVSLSVHNTGSVIPPEALPRIFDRFFQADPASASAEGNTGLGLAITREIVEAHGGRIEVTSSPSAGTRFVVTLPIQPPDAGQPG